MPIQPSTLNHRLTTPNKLFEAMAVGVPVVASDRPGMAGIVRESGGGSAGDPTSPGRSRPRCEACSPPTETIARRWARADSRPPTRRTTGRGSWRSCRGVQPRDGTAVVTAKDGHRLERPRAILLIADWAAPYSRGLARRARSLGEAGYDVEIAAIAAPGLPEREPVAPRRCRARSASLRRIRRESARSRYDATGRLAPGRSSGASEAATAATSGGVSAGGPPAGARRALRRVARMLAAPLLVARRWLFWPHAVRGWWATPRPGACAPGRSLPRLRVR